MKGFLCEIWDPIKEFYQMRTKGEIGTCIAGPIMGGVLSFIIGMNIHPGRGFVLSDLCEDFLNQILTILTLLISFSMAYLSILISSSSKNIDGLKSKESKKYFLGQKACTLYQVLASEITYTIVFEIVYLILVLPQRFLIYIFSERILEIMLSIDITLFLHVMLMMLVIVKDIYFSFWRSK